MMKKQTLIWWAAVVLSAIYIVVAGRRAGVGRGVTYRQAEDVPSVKAKVVQIIDPHYEKVLYAGYDGDDQVVLFTAEFTSGLKRGITTEALQYLDAMYAGVQEAVQPGDKIVLYQDEGGPVGEYIFSSFYRSNYIAIMAGAFAVLLLIMGGIKGVNTLISLGYTLAAVFGVFIPAVLNGQDIHTWAVSTCIFIILMTIVIVNGLTDKSIAAIIGCCAGVLVAGSMALMADRLMHITGLATEESMYLYFINTVNPINLKGIVFASIIFGSVGAIMDVAMSLAAALAEVKQQAGAMSGRQIFKSGITIGRDMMGTMANTLILAYIGSSLGITLLTMCYNNPGLMMANSEMIVDEVLQGLAGSIGIQLTIPITSAICGVLLGTDSKTE